jgi:hypothetical protein
MAIFSKPSKTVIHIHFHGVDGVLEKLAVVETNLKESIMATKDEFNVNADLQADEKNQAADL